MDDRASRNWLMSPMYCADGCDCCSISLMISGGGREGGEVRWGEVRWGEVRWVIVENGYSMKHQELSQMTITASVGWTERYIHQSIDGCNLMCVNQRYTYTTHQAIARMCRWTGMGHHDERGVLWDKPLHSMTRSDQSMLRACEHDMITCGGVQIIQYNTIQHNTIQYNTIQCNASQHNTPVSTAPLTVAILSLSLINRSDAFLSSRDSLRHTIHLHAHMWGWVW